MSEAYHLRNEELRKDYKKEIDEMVHCKQHYYKNIERIANALEKIAKKYEPKAILNTKTGEIIQNPKWHDGILDNSDLIEESRK